MYDKEKREVKIYIRLIMYYLRHRTDNGSMDDFYGRMIYTARQYLPYVTAKRRKEIVEYVSSFINNDMTIEEKIDLLKEEVERS